jgi:hypothetical protein
MTKHWRTVVLTSLLLGTLSTGALAQQKTHRRAAEERVKPVLGCR